MTLHFTALFWQTSELSISVNISSALWLLEFLIGSEFRIYLPICTFVWFEPKYNWMNLFLKVWAKKQWDEPFFQWIILFLCNTVFPEMNMTDYEFRICFVENPVWAKKLVEMLSEGAFSFQYYHARVLTTFFVQFLFYRNNKSFMDIS